MAYRALITFSAIIFAIVGSSSARVQTGFLNRTARVAGKSYRYQVYVPATFRSQKSWPVILFLHGSGERGSDGLLQTQVGLPSAIRQNNARFPFIVVMPQCSPKLTWSSPDMRLLALQALDHAIKEFHGDRRRVFLSGLSMGGFGTWELAVAQPGRFAALVPICSGVRPLSDWPDLRVDIPGDPMSSDPYAEVARRIGKTPVWMFHGDADDSVPVEESRHMAAALKAAGADFKYTEYPGVGHNSWDKAYAEPDLVVWLLSKSLK